MFAEKKEKFISFDLGFHSTGILSDAIKSEINGELYFNYKIDSVFPLEISEIPKAAKIGDWIFFDGVLPIKITSIKTRRM